VPTYRIVATRGQAHAQTFEVACEVPALQLQERGEGRSRRTAEQEAARRMLDTLKASDRPAVAAPRAADPEDDEIEAILRRHGIS